MNFYNGIFIGGGKGTGLIDSFVLKDYRNKPYIPGSTLKGRIRHNYTLLSNSFFQMDEGLDTCKLFGGSGNNPGILYFENLKLQDDSIGDKYLYNSRVGILINRCNKLARDQAFFQYETMAIDKGQKFIGNIEGYIEDRYYKKQIILLYASIKMIQTLGGSQSRGLGWLDDDCRAEIFLDDEAVSVNTLQKWGEEIGI